MGIFALVATFMAQTLGSGLRGVLQGKRREVATQLANQRMEEARSLSYNAIGLIQETFAADPAGEPFLNVVNGEFRDRPVVWVPHIDGHPFEERFEEITQGSTRLTRYTYVTWESPDLKRIEVRVTWDDVGAQGPMNEVRVQTLVNESGLIPTGRAGKPLTGKAFATGGQLNLQSSLLGLPLEGLNITLPTSSGSSSFRAVQSAACTARSASVQALGLVDLPGYSVAATADDDPRTPTPSYSSDQAAGLLSIPVGPVANLIGPLLDSPIECEASATGLAFEEGSGSVLEVLNAQTSVTALLGHLNWAFQLARIETLPVTQSVEQQLVGDQREIASAANAGIGTVNLLRIPGVIPDGVVRLDAVSYGASVRGADGTPSQPPIVDSPVINLRIYDNQNQLGSTCTSRSGAYCLVTVDPDAAGFNGLTIQLQGSLTHALGGLFSSLNPLQLLNLASQLGLTVTALLNLVANLSYEVSLDVLPPAEAPPGGVESPTGERRWHAEYTPVTVSASLQATLLGNPILGASADLGVGIVRAEACAGVTC